MKGLQSGTLLFILITVLFACKSENPGEENILTIKDNWKLSKLGSNERMKVDMPATVQSVLFSEGIINDPFSEQEEKNIEWIENEDWQYSTWFKTSDAWFAYDKIELVCKGLDTYATVYLNGDTIISANNMFRTWSADIKPFLKSGRNELRIVFKSSVEMGNRAKAKLEYLLPTSDYSEDHKVASFVRKAPYHFGWDWGPRIITSGIWKDVEINGWKHFKIDNIGVEILEINKNEARLKANIDIETIDETKLYLKLESEQCEIKDNLVGYFLDGGKNQRSFEFTIENPQLWWPNGMGDQYLYDLKFSFSLDPQQKSNYSRNVRTGIRKIRLIQQKDSIGSSFQFTVNNALTFAKGANYIPQDVFLENLNESDYRRLLYDVKESNMNMIRVWGGGIYEDDLFYDLCDSLGIMVWQDFMFACAMYPGDREFLENVEEEAIEQSKRLQNHPSIALWCGNNEIDVAWKNWGWQEEFNYSYAQASKIYRDYEVIFQELLPSVISKYDNEVPYVHTSPLSNWGSPENYNHSSMHYWGVWHGEESFENVELFIPRFMTEYGFQSYPSEELLSRYISSSALDLVSPVMLNRQKSYKGNGLISKHIEEYYTPATDFADYIYKSQLTQAKYMNMAINAHRAANKRCAGSLYWQLNDCWPGPSWSTIDYAKNWKAAQYRVRDRYQQIIVIPKVEGNRLKLFVDSDERVPRKVELQLSLKAFSGELLYSDTIYDFIYPGGSNNLKEYEVSRLLSFMQRRITYADVRLISEEKILDEELIFFGREKDLNLEAADFNYTITKGDTITIDILSNTLAKNVELSFKADGKFSNNYFDMQADSTYRVTFIPKVKEGTRSELFIRSLNPPIED